MELVKVYLALQKIKNLDFKKREFIDGRGEDVPEGVAYEVGNSLALKLKEVGQEFFYVSGDGRISTPQLIKGFSDAMIDNKINVIHAGYNNVTPMFYVERMKLGVSGVNITASHNPWNYNGFKVFIEPRTDSGEILEKLEKLQASGNMKIYAKNGARNYYLQSMLRKDYLGDLEKKFKQMENKKQEGKILYDGLNGPSFPFFSDVAQKLGLQFDGFREIVNGSFPLIYDGPSPLLKENFEIMKNTLENLDRYSLILITDGDADRLSVANSSGLIDFAVVGATRAVYLAEKKERIEDKKGKPKFVAEYALASIIGNYLAEKGIEVVPVPRGIANHFFKIQELGEKGENVLGGQEIGTHPYNSLGIDDGVEDALLFSEILLTKGKRGLEDMFDEAREGVKKHIHELRFYCKDQLNVRRRLLEQPYASEKFEDVVCNINGTEAVIHSSNTSNQITVNACSDNGEGIEKDLNALFKDIGNIEPDLGKKLEEGLEIIR